MRLKFKVNLGRDKRESRRPFPGIRDNELNPSTIPPKTGRVVTLGAVNHHNLSTFVQNVDPNDLRLQVKWSVVWSCWNYMFWLTSSKSPCIVYSWKIKYASPLNEIRWKKVWSNNMTVQKPCPHVDTVLLKNLGDIAQCTVSSRSGRVQHVEVLCL